MSARWWAVLVLGLWVTFQYASAAWPFQADIATPYAIWAGVQRFGLGFIASWLYTQDNWLLTIVAPQALLYDIFGPHIVITTVLGWLTFVGGVVAIAAVARITLAPKASLPLAALLMLPAFATLGMVGFMAHPVSHTVSAVWAVAALWSAAMALRHRSAVATVLSAVLVFANVFSDPWAGAAIGVPIVLVATAVAAVHFRTRQGWIALALAITNGFAFAAAHTQLFGWVDFLRVSELQLTDPAGALANIGLAFRTLGIMFNIVPFAGHDAIAAIAFSALAVLCLLGWAMGSTLANWQRSNAESQLVGGAAILSVLMVLAAFTVGRWPTATTEIGRFFPNVYLLGGLLLAGLLARNWAGWRRPTRVLVGAYLVLFAISGLASHPRLWLTFDTGWRTPAAAEWTRFITDNGLSYGYGPYWGTGSLALPLTTDGKVTVRPVSFRSGRVQRRVAGTSSFWYRSDDEPPDLERRFVIMVDDGEECPVVERCIETAERQFGRAAERLVYGKATILVWHRSLAADIDP